MFRETGHLDLLSQHQRCSKIGCVLDHCHHQSVMQLLQIQIREAMTETAVQTQLLMLQGCQHFHQLCSLSVVFDFVRFFSAYLVDSD